MDSQNLDFPPEIIETLKTSQRVAVLTGSGISAESGVPTFREAQTGLWSRFDPTELATPEAFKADPKLVWEWYTWRRQLISQAKPNPGHHALVEMEDFYPDFTLITQNVDGLHRLAGSRSIIELHGDISRTRCSQDNVQISEQAESNEFPPRCPHCGSLLRPDVVWFGESLPSEALEAAVFAVNSCQIFLSVGTSTLVEPAASLPFLALRNGATVIEINPQETPLTPLANFSSHHPAGKALPQLAAAIKRL
jgi:NAD-dependent deacetylase